jgi:membrane protease YdiL (CAAX protease family)
VLPPATWRAIEALPVFLISLVGTFVLSVFVLAVRSCAGRFTLGALAGELSLGASVLLWVKLVSKAPLAALGKPRAPFRDIGVGVLAGIALVFLGALAVVIVDTIVTTFVGHQVTQPDQVEPCVRGAWLIASGPVIVLAAPLGEELFFRGFLYRGLRRRYSQWPAAIISALVFGFVHYQGVSFLLIIPGLAVVGLGLALLFERRQSLLATIAAHAAFNAVGFAMIAWGR